MKFEKIRINGLHNLKKSNWEKANASLTDAFSEDPCLLYLLQSNQYNPEKARFIHEYTLKYGFQNGIVHVTSNNAEGVSVWLPPETNSHSAIMHVWNFIICGGLKMGKQINFGTIDVMRKYASYSSKLHHKYTKEPHWYLMSVGIAKKFQGMGYSKKLILPMLTYFDKNQQACYLETHNPNNVVYYEKLGFNTMEIGKLPGTTIKHYAMLRKPNKQN